MSVPTTRKGWSQPTLDALGVTHDGHRWAIPTASGTLRYADDGREPKMLAANGSKRELWPSPEDVEGPVLIVVEGEPDAISATELGYPTVGLPGAGKFDPSWPARLVAGRRRVVLVGDCDEVGRARMRSVAEQVAKVGGNAYLIDLDVERSDGYDLGDMLVELGPAQARVVLDAAIVEAVLFVPDVPDALSDEQRRRLEALIPRGPKLRVLDTHTLLTTEPPPLDWLVDGVFCKGYLTLFGGREKRGKSLVQLALAVCMASGGGECAGIAVKPGRVLIFDAENGEREAHRRLRALGLSPAHAANLTVVEVQGFDLRDDLDEIKSRAEGYDLVLLDSFRALWRGKERDEDEVPQALDPLRELAHGSDAAYGLTHHAQKGGDEYRGSSAIGACVEWCCMLERIEEDPQKSTRRRLTNPLSRFAAGRDDRWLSIRSEGDEGPVSLEAAEPFVPTRDAPKRDGIEAELRAIVEGCGGEVSSSTDLTTSPSWTNADFARLIDRDPKDWTVREAVKRLAEAGVIHRNGNGRWWPGMAPGLRAELDERAGGFDYSNNKPMVGSPAEGIRERKDLA